MSWVFAIIAIFVISSIAFMSMFYGFILGLRTKLDTPKESHLFHDFTDVEQKLPDYPLCHRRYPGYLRWHNSYMKHRSKKMEAKYVERRKIVAELLREQPLCERCASQYATDVHEIKTRARGGSILDRENLACLCRACHTWVTQNPRLALEQGWVKNSWDD